MIVLDASALLAFLFQEPGHELVAPHLDDCCLSTVNLSEVIGRFVRDGHDAEAVLNKLLSTRLKSSHSHRSMQVSRHFCCRWASRLGFRWPTALV